MSKKSEAIKKLQRQIAQIDTLKQMRRDSPDFKLWKRNTEVLIARLFGTEGRHGKDFTNIDYDLNCFGVGTPDHKYQEVYKRGLDEARAMLQSLCDEINEFWNDHGTDLVVGGEPIASVLRVVDRFHRIARQLRNRHDSRPTLDVNDEYDIQDLLHSLLLIFFEDVRPEEWTPSYAGGSARMDFLLKAEQIVIEVKRTRQTLTARDVGDQLIVDIGRYQAHPDCKTLICFVYDPEGRIGNAVGLERDLTEERDGVDVRVIVAPKGG